MRRKADPTVPLRVNYAQTFLSAVYWKIYGTRKNFNKERVLLLTSGPLKNEFQNDLQRVRSLFSVPQLDPADDYQLVISDDHEFEESSWIHALSDHVYLKFESEVTQLLAKYELADSFRDWVEFYLLYRKKPKSYPKHNIDSMIEIPFIPERSSQTPLTSQEKRFAQKFIPQMLGFTKKPTKQLAEVYGSIRARLQQSKNKKRSFRNLDKSLRVFKEKQNGSKYAEVGVKIFTYDQEERMGPEGMKALLRKNHQRLLQRASLHTSK